MSSPFTLLAVFVRPLEDLFCSIPPKFKAKYTISDSETSNQNRHWQTHHFDHWFKSVKEPALQQAGKTDEEVNEAKEEAYRAIMEKGKAKVQASLVSFAVSGSTLFGIPGCFIPPAL